ncbi:MAG TPA: alpha/beta hydrolase [Chitinophagaceae bacterium]|nr:alpha/beta hydrolase [Chitinophagaceae bacterium]
MAPWLINVVILFFHFNMNAQTVIPLYTGEIPNSRSHPNEEISTYNPDGVWIVSKVSQPSLTIFLPPAEKATGTAIIICPGGGYTNLAMGYEGDDVARRYNESGIAAFVLKYRIPDDSTMFHKKTGPLQDAQRALQLVRSSAVEWGIYPDRIGIMGFSAGGHLASTAGTHFDTDFIPNPDHISLRPDFMILIYPVISFDSRIAHIGSLQNLLGTHPSPEEIKEFSNEEQVTDQTPPAFLVHAKDDNAVPYANSLVFADALKKHHVPVELYLYDQGGHGFGMVNKTSPQSWVDLSIRWLNQEHLLRQEPGSFAPIPEK